MTVIVNTKFNKEHYDFRGNGGRNEWRWVYEKESTDINKNKKAGVQVYSWVEGMDAWNRPYSTNIWIFPDGWEYPNKDERRFEIESPSKNKKKFSFFNIFKKEKKEEVKTSSNKRFTI